MKEKFISKTIKQERKIVSNDDPLFMQTKEYLKPLIWTAINAFKLSKENKTKLFWELVNDVPIAAQRFLENDGLKKDYKFSAYFGWYIGQRINKIKGLKRKKRPSKIKIIKAMKNQTKKSIIIRKPKRKEFLKICRLLNRTEKPYQKIVPDYEAFKVTDFERMLRKTKRSFLVIELDKKIAGFAAWKIKNKKICWLSILHIDPRKQKMGLGTKLLQEIEKIAKKKNCIFTMLELFPQANWAKSFYLKNNYKILSKKDYGKRIFKGILSPKTKTLVMIKSI